MPAGLSRAQSTDEDHDDAPLLFDIELDEDDSRHARCHKVVPRGQSPIAKLVKSIHTEFPVLYHFAEQAARIAADTTSVDLEVFARQFANLGYRAWVRRGTGSARSKSSRSSYGFHRNHEFVVVQLTDGDTVVVDPHFWEQFHISSAPEKYKSLLTQLPPVFVGTVEHIKVVSLLLCAEMEHAFHLLGVSCPPWRTYKALVSRWLVTSAEDTLVEASKRSAETAADYDVHSMCAAFSKQALTD